MNLQDRLRAFEYSSLVMGSRDIPSVSFPQKRPSILTSAKTFSKKSDLLTSKYSKVRSTKIRTRNERPDIFLEGQQLAKNNNAWQQEIDFRYFENIRQKMRKSTPSNFIKGQASKITVKGTTGQRSTPTWTEFQEENATIYSSEHPRVNSLSKPSNNKNQRIYSTDRHQTAVQKQSPPPKRQLQRRLQQKLMQKAQLRLEESSKTIEEMKRKQLFYITQKDLSTICSESFIVVQYPTGQVITGYYYKKIVEIASLTKIMTFYTILRLLNHHNLDPQTQMVQIDDKIADISGTSAQLYEGDHYSVKQLLYALMLPSGNDAAVALARWGGRLLSGDPRQFVSLMNKLAYEIGMKSSSFGNPHGLPHPQNGSTAQDVSILVRKCLEFNIFRQVIQCKSFRCWTENERVRREVAWQNTNKLLRRPGFEGVKTGVTVTAGPCLASLYTAHGRSFVVILLRTNKLSRRFKQTRWILRMCLRRMNFDGGFTTAIRELGRQDPQMDSDNSEQQQQFNFDRNDPFELDRRRRIIINEL